MENNQQPTHEVAPSTKKPGDPITALKTALMTGGSGSYLQQVKNYYGGREEEALRFMTAAVDYVRRIPKLLECDQTSLMTALVNAAQFRFMPSGVMGECYIIPYGREAKFQIGYQGIVTLLYRTNRIASITSNIIYQNDEFDYQEGVDAHLIHKPAMFGKKKGEPIGVYTVVQMKGGAKTFKVLDKDGVMGIKNLSKAKNSAESPWNSDKDPEMWMWRKTCLIQHAKLLPKTQELQQAIERDYEGEGSANIRPDVSGPATGKAAHEPEAE